ncbi:beta-lactamase-like protein [Massariosphaeria phaeospora]|uniref:Cleavage and polyadenylation specificity factor subunit 2 n=1 Tax=Massariosphaeria phaeospora TaxID=100035 RepID=A0A7C8MJ29_9PLEO|nr:beta-lactamase-like protein [Massariosphaeria phaeospora]
MFNFTPLLGAQSASPASQSLLEFDGGVKVLVDVGWDETFDAEKLKDIEKHVPTLSFILLTHATTAHLGAFVHCCKHFPLFTRIPVYATTPVISLGRTLLQDLYASTPLAASTVPTAALTESAYSIPSLRDGHNPNILLQAPTPDEIAHFFGLINPLKYSQPHQPLPSPFSPPLSGLTITAYSAGHTLGGTIWHIQHGMESVVYAVDWNQAREHVLSGAAWLGGPGTGGSEVLEQLRRPTALICSSKGSGLVNIAGQRHNRDDALLSMIRDTVAKGGSVLIPSDSSARILELAYMLEETWQNDMIKGDNSSPLKHAKVYLASRTGGATMRYVRSMLEWMEEGIVKEFEIATGAQEVRDQRRNRQQGGPRGDGDKEVRAPFDFRHITLLERKSRVMRMLAGTEPRIILASDTSLEWGFSKDALRSLASDERNLIILTERVGEIGGQEKGLGRYLWDLWNERSASSGQDSLSAAIVNTSGSQATLKSVQTAPLEGPELPLYQQFLARQRQLQNTIQGDSGTALETSADVVDDRSSSTSTTSEGSDIEHQGKALNTATTLQHSRHKLGLTDAELGINVLIRRKNIYDYEVQGKKGREKLFPFVAKRRRVDDFGDLIRPEDYTRADEEDQVAGEALRNGSKKENAVGQKRKWDDLAVRNVDGGRRLPNGGPKRRRADSDAMDVSDSEPEDGADALALAGPSKVVIRTETLHLHCRISFVDFSGLHDRRTIQTLIPLIKPRKLIFVAGEGAETRDLAEYCRTALNAGGADGGAPAVDVFTPAVGALVDASVDTNAWSVKLSVGMVRRLQWQKVRGLGVVAITGRLAAASLEGEVVATDPSSGLQQKDDDADDGSLPKKPKLDSTSPSLSTPPPPPTSSTPLTTLPILDSLPPNLSTPLRSIAQPFHVGDLRLADLRKILLAGGMSAEFRGEGVLVINGVVAVRKTGSGKVEVDGGAYAGGGGGGGGIGGNLGSGGGETATFWRVRRKIYEGLAVVAGG